jgi:hypothetical protein
VGKYGTARQATDDTIIGRTRFACWITEAADTHSECVISIAFSRQKWLRERTSMLGYTHIISVVNTHVQNEGCWHGAQEV